ncbi:MAG TPA: ATPase domain-containing protein [Candidatus Nitrosopolaris sp.]|nr:ATPase domain-containing protein [Candidatus Nitrosopolaris sp.]
MGKHPGRRENDTISNKRPEVPIPNELLEFVRRDTYSLLVKGYAGAGKTTLSLTILRALKIKNNFFYISTRLSPKQLFVYYPWLGRYVDIVPNQDESPSLASSSQRIGYNLSSFEDARLDEPESLFERITNQLMDVKAPIIIIDSWDAIASFMDKEARLNNERVLQTWRERAGAKLIFISEDPTDTTLDFLVDGIVELDQNLNDGIRIRKIALTKLRGIQIKRPSYIFTLNKGIFQSYNPYDPCDFMFSNSYNKNNINDNISQTERQRRSSRHTPSPRQDYHVPSGYEELDEALGGGFPKKGIVLLETQPNIHAKITLTILAGVISNLLKHDNPVLIEASGGVDTKVIMSYLRPYLPAEHTKDLVKIFCTSINDGLASNPTASQYQSRGNSEKQTEYFRDLIAKVRQNHPNKLLVNVLGMTMCHRMHLYNEANWNDLLPFISATADLTLLAVRGAQSSEVSLSEMADVQLRLTSISGTLVLHCVKPETQPYAVVTDRSVAYPAINLESLV